MRYPGSLILHETFRAAITLKGIGGILEMVGGVLLWFVKLSSMNRVIQAFCENELSRDPYDLIATHVLHVSVRLANSDPSFASVYLLSHGLVKVVLVVSLWLDKLWAYPLTIFVFSLFIFYQTYRFTHTHSMGLALLSIFDLVIIWLTWREYRAMKQVRGKHP